MVWYDMFPPRRTVYGIWLVEAEGRPSSCGAGLISCKCRRIYLKVGETEEDVVNQDGDSVGDWSRTSPSWRKRAINPRQLHVFGPVVGLLCARMVSGSGVSSTASKLLVAVAQA